MGKMCTRQLSENKLLLYAAVFVFSFLIIIRDIFGADISKFLLLLTYAAFIVFLNKKDIYCFIAFIAPISTGVSYATIALIALFVSSIKKPHFRVKLSSLICIGFIIVLEMISAYRFEFSYVSFIRFISVFLLVFIRMSDCNNDYDDKGILVMFVIGFMVASASIWGQMLNTYSLLDLLSLGIRFGNVRHALNITEGMIVSYNANGLASLCLMNGWICVFLIQRAKTMNVRLLYAAAIMFSIIQGFMTQSRMYIVVLGLSIIILLVDTVKEKKKIVLILIMTAVFVIVLTIVIHSYFMPYLENLMQRMENSDSTGGRIELIKQYFVIWGKNVVNILIGVGVQDYYVKYGMEIASHNSIQEILLIWGVTGLIVVGALFSLIIDNSKKVNRSVKAIQYAPLFILLLTTQSGQGFSDMSGMLRLIAAFSVIMLPNPAEEKGKLLNAY